MCRISGLTSNDVGRHEGSRLSTLRAMRDSMQSGGPDFAGEFIDDHISLGHRRLSVMDTSHLGSQPFFSVCKRYILVYNGELYNFLEVRVELVRRGYIFFSESDTEVLLCALIEWGVDCLHRFRGMFAFAFYDRGHRKVLLARDRAGEKPLFYYFDGQVFGFASELKAFHMIPGFSPDIDTQSRSIFFKYGYVPAPRSIYQGVYKLEPGHFLTVDVVNPSTPVPEPYWDVRSYYAAPKSNLSYSDAVDHLEELLTETIKLQMNADVPVGIFLSGGVDSSTVVAMLASNSTKKIRTFNMGFDDSSFNEAPYARKVAKYFGTEHNEHNFSLSDCTNIIPRLPSIWDEPFGDSSQIPTLLLAEFTRKYVKVSLSADGADEMFYGYQKYSMSESRHRVINRTRLLLKPMRHIGESRLLVIGHKMGLGEKLAKAVSVANAGVGLLDTFLIAGEVFSPTEIDRLFGGGCELGRIDESFSLGDWEIKTPIEQILAVDFRTYLADDILCKLDRATMAVGLEGRGPLLDHKIIEFAASLPYNYKTQNGVSKRILRDVLYRHIPRNLIDRPKMGFGVPVESWMREVPSLRERLEWYLSKELLQRSGFQDVKYIENLLYGYLNNGFYFKKIWQIYSYQAWFDRWAK